MQKERDETKEAVADIAKSLQVEKETAQDLFLIFQDQMDGNAKDLLDVVKREKVRFEHVIVLFQDSLQQEFSV